MVRKTKTMWISFDAVFLFVLLFVALNSSKKQRRLGKTQKQTEKPKRKWKIQRKNKFSFFLFFLYLFKFILFLSLFSLNYYFLLFLLTLFCCGFVGVFFVPSHTRTKIGLNRKQNVFFPSWEVKSSCFEEKTKNKIVQNVTVCLLCVCLCWRCQCVYVKCVCFLWMCESELFI